MARRIFLISTTLLVVGFGLGYAVGYTTFGYVLLHIGGLGSLGLLASGAGYIATRKGYEYWRAFYPALSSSIILGTIGVYLVPPGEGEGRPAACGGSVSLFVALVFLVVWAVRKQKGEMSSSSASEA